MVATICAIYDVTARSFSAPECYVNSEMAVRTFKIKMETMPKEVVRDSDLYEIGSYDTITGEIVPSTPSVIFKGGELVNG